MKNANDVVKQIKNKMEKAYNPTAVHKQQITAASLQELKDDEEIVLQHPLIKGLVLKIRRECMIDTVLNAPVVFYGSKYIISDSGDNVFPQHEVLLNEKEMTDYVKQLLAAPHAWLFYYFRSLARKGLSPGDIIEFEDGKKGIIVIPEGDSFGRNLAYIPLKKDGTKSKHKPRILYGNDTYKK